MDQQIKIIRQKLDELAQRDTKFQIFGAFVHRYRKRTPLSEHEVKSFEKKYSIQLPPDYREFLLQVSNGGAGPYYGLEPLENGLYQDLDNKDSSNLTNPALEFPLTEAWNLEFMDIQEEAYDQTREIEYFDNKWTNGLLRISNFGCGVSMNLVVNGKEYGNIWVDDRCNDGGIFPDPYFGNEGRIAFLDWYELWLDKSLSQLPSLYANNTPVKTPKSWWERIFNKKS